MRTTLFIEPAHYPAVFGISITIITFLLYWIISKSKTIISLLQAKFGKEKTLIYKVLFQKISGLVFLGIIPLVIIFFSDYTLTQFGVNNGNITQSIYWVLSLGWAIFLISFFVSKNPKNYKTYPQMRISLWDIQTIVLDSISWILYLLSYEFLFRGVLLFSCLETFGFTGSIIINVIIYAVAHIPKGLMETVGSIPTGAILCYITISTGNIWAAVILHSIMALSNDFVSLYHNPEMKITRSKNK